MKRISTDFQGWSLNAMTWREIFDKFSTNCNGTQYDFNNELLDSYPRLLEDDGMGYGVNSRYVISVDHEFYKDKELEENVTNLFIEPILKEDNK